MTKKRALQIVVAIAVEHSSGQPHNVSFTDNELRTAIYLTNKHIKWEVK